MVVAGHRDPSDRCPVRREPRRPVLLDLIDGLGTSADRRWRRRSIVQFNVTPNVTLGYLASITNVTLGLQRADGNVTLAGQSTVGWREREGATGR